MNKDLIDKKQVEKLLQKIKDSQVKNKFDLSQDEDLSIAIMNLVSIEEHMFFTAVKTGKIKYLDVLNEVRQMRKKLLKKIVRDYEGEVWCISKHLLAAVMRLNEVGTKSLNQGEKEEAWKFFNDAYKLYSLFWGLNLGVVKSKELKTDLAKMGFAKNEFVENEQIVQNKDNTVFDKLGALVKKVLDCCIE